MVAAIAAFSHGHLPVVKAYLSSMGVANTVDALLPCRMAVRPGQVVEGLVLNVTGGRFPVYRVEEFYRGKDAELLLGLNGSSLTDDTIGRVLDRIYEYGTWKLFSSISLEACRRFEVERDTVHQDTTSESVWGDYRPQQGDPFQVTYGFSKDGRPDLKQFMVSLLCVEKNIPMEARTLSGNASDKATQRDLLSGLSDLLSRHEIPCQAFTYVADSALITPTNLDLLDQVNFISRLPETYSACGQAVRGAVANQDWQSVGQLCDSPKRGRVSGARYRLQEGVLEVNEKPYRAVVVHSDAHDRRRQKKLDKEVKQDATAVLSKVQELHDKDFFCKADAEAAAQALSHGKYHRVKPEVYARPMFARGRPRRDGTRKVRDVRWGVRVQVLPSEAEIDRRREEAGCFVLITSVPTTQRSALEILRLYKEQHGIEQNFAFLKDPHIANDVFLKKPHRIEAMFMIRLVALLVWRLMERTMRKNLEQENQALPGWNNRPSRKPTGWMVVSRFRGVTGLRFRGRRILSQPLDEAQQLYLKALGVPQAVFTRLHPPVLSLARVG